MLYSKEELKKKISKANFKLEARMNKQQENPIDNEPVFHGFTLTEIDNAFDKIKNEIDWKLPIEVEVEKDEVNLIEAAIAFHVGYWPIVNIPPDGSKPTISSAGYHMLVEPSLENEKH